MMKAAKDEWHQLGNEIYTTYIKKQHVGIRLNKQILKVSAGGGDDDDGGAQ